MGARPAATAIVLASLSLPCATAALAMSGPMAECLLARIEQADPGVTVGELSEACARQLADPAAAVAEQRPSAVDIRVDADFDNRTRQFSISPHQSNYIIYSYNDSPNEDPFGVEPNDFFDNEELKFQVSFKMPVATGLFGGDTDLLFAYTSVAWWQAFNDEIKNPFRETNYEPEVFLQNYTDAEWLGVDLVSWQLGFNHQSNGQSEPTSRGWDRAIAGAAFELTDDLVLGLRAWHILDAQRDNADIERYMGYADLGLGWVPNRNTFTLMYRPASEGDAWQLTWSYPISRYLRLYAQYWNGYGESLIDYNVRTERFGIGIALNDVLARHD